MFIKYNDKRLKYNTKWVTIQGPLFGELYRFYDGTFNDSGVFHGGTNAQFITGPSYYGPSIHYDEGIKNIKVSAEFYLRYSVSTSAMASAFKAAGRNSANPQMLNNILCEIVPGTNPGFRVISNVPSPPFISLDVVNNNLSIPWSSISAEYMDNIANHNYTATITDERPYSASWSGEINYTGNKVINDFRFEYADTTFNNTNGFVSMNPQMSMMTNLLIEPSFNSYSASDTWSYSRAI